MRPSPRLPHEPAWRSSDSRPRSTADSRKRLFGRRSRPARLSTSESIAIRLEQGASRLHRFSSGRSERLMLDRANGHAGWRPAERSDLREVIGYADVVAFLWQNAWILALSLFLGVVGAAVVVFLSEPLFTARSQLLIDPRTPQLPRDQKGEPSIQLDAAQ